MKQKITLGYPIELQFLNATLGICECHVSNTPGTQAPKWVSGTISRDYHTVVSLSLEGLHILQAPWKAMSKIRKNIYRSDVHINFELYDHFKGLRVFIPNTTLFTKYCLSQWIFTE